MINAPIDIDRLFPIRKSRKQKRVFREEVQKYAEALGYKTTVEKGSFGAHNVVIGNPKNAKYLITAHYDTCAWLPFPNLITPSNVWTFLLYQLLILLVWYVSGVPLGFVVWLLTRSLELAGLTAYIFSWLFFIFMLFGPANRHNSNDNTSGVVTVLEIARSLPENLRDKVCFVLFDLEESGLIGSSSYQSKHKKETKNQIVLNLDCVGDGDEIVFFPTKKFRKDPGLSAWLSGVCGKLGPKSIAIRKKGFAYYPSDQANFPFGVGICALRRSRWAGLYLSRIHTGRDTILEETNVNILRACLTTLVSSDAAK